MSRKRSKLVLVTVRQEVEDVLEDKRTTLKFPDMLECLVKWSEHNYQYFKSDEDIQQAASVENKLWKFPLGLRLVCSDWNKAIEQFFKTTDYKLIKASRFLKIDSENVTKVKFYTQLLSKFGRQIQSMDLQIDSPYVPNVESYMIPLELLKNLQSLQNLTINSEYAFPVFMESQLNKAISLNPCPILHKLANLRVVGKLYNQVINEILKNSNNIESLKHYRPGFQSCSLDSSINLPYLTDLDVTIDSDDHFQQLKYLGKNWKLKKFSGNFSGLREDENRMDIFTMLGDNWFGSLEELCIRLPEGREKFLTNLILNLTLSTRLELSQLKTVEIASVLPVPLDFLLPCQNTLENIRVAHWGEFSSFRRVNQEYDYAMKNKIVKYIGVGCGMSQLNIWHLFPKLKSISCESKTVCRPPDYNTMTD